MPLKTKSHKKLLLSVLIAGALPAALSQTTSAASSDSADTSSSDTSYLNLDWLQLSPMDSTGKVCQGAYAEPPIWNGHLTPGNADRSTTIEANRSSSMLGGITELTGDVVIQQSGRKIASSYAEYDSANRQALLRDNVRYREPGFLLRANTISADLDNRVAIANETSYVLHESELRGEALALTRYADSSIETQDALVTFCEPGSDDWAIRAQEMSLYPEEGYGESWHTRFEVAGVPVFYLPYFYFPLDDTRRSGFLYPSLSKDNTNGLDLAIPYYFNIAPNIDDTLTTRLIENRGISLENELRYLNSYSMNQLSTSWMPEDSITNEQRWLVNIDHSGRPAPGWSSSIDFSRVSDDQYFDDLRPVELRVPQSDDLDQRASLSFSANSWTASALISDYQTIDGDPEPYARMPQLSIQGSERMDNISLNYLAQYTDFQHDGFTDGNRIHLRPSLSYDLTRTWGYVRPEVGLWHSQYDLSNSTTPSATAEFASLDTGLIFERQGELTTQSLEPRLKLTHVGGDATNTLLNAPSGSPEFFDAAQLGFSADNLFDTLGYTGNDRVAHTQQATLGLTSRLHSLSGREVLTAGIAQVQYFGDHDPRLGDTSRSENSSDYAINASWKPSDSLRFNHGSRLDRADGDLLSHNYSVLYSPDSDKLLYSSYRQSSLTSTPTEQLDIAAQWPLNSNWALVSRYTEDLDKGENLETLFGVEYGSCCWKLRFTGKRSVVDSNVDFQRDNTFYLQFVLKGLGTLGGSGGRNFLRDLTGFDEDANENF